VASRSARVVRNSRRRWFRARMMSLSPIVSPASSGVDRPTQGTIAKVDPQLGHVARVVADDDVLADVGRERGVEIAEPLKMNAIPATWLATVSSSRSS